MARARFPGRRLRARVENRGQLVKTVLTAAHLVAHWFLESSSAAGALEVSVDGLTSVSVQRRRRCRWGLGVHVRQAALRGIIWAAPDAMSPQR